MWYQPARAARERPLPEPPGAVPLGAPPHYDERDDTQALQSPFPPDAGSVARGQSLFIERCASCHGPKGHGGGPVSRFFPPAPDLAYVAVRERSDGYIYGTILLGGRAMPRVSEGLDERDRWDLVHYVRAVQGLTPQGASR